MDYLLDPMLNSMGFGWRKARDPNDLPFESMVKGSDSLSEGSSFLSIIQFLIFASVPPRACKSLRVFSFCKTTKREFSLWEPSRLPSMHPLDPRGFVESGRGRRLRGKPNEFPVRQKQGLVSSKCTKSPPCRVRFLDFDEESILAQHDLSVGGNR